MKTAILEDLIAYRRTFCRIMIVAMGTKLEPVVEKFEVLERTRDKEIF